MVDGNSDDGGPDIARAHPRTICTPQNGYGFAHAWNVGIAASRGDFITFLDSDDLWTPGKLAAQLTVFDREPAIEYVHGRVEFFVDAGASLPRGFHPDLLTGSCLSHMTGVAMVRRETVQSMGPFELDLKIASDIEWFARLRDSAITGVVDDVLLRKRLHRTNLSHTTSWHTLKSELFQILKQRADASRFAGRTLADREPTTVRPGR